MLEPANCPTGMVLALADALPTFGIKGPIGSKNALQSAVEKSGTGSPKMSPILPRYHV